MEGINFKNIFVIIALLLQLEDSTSPGCFPSKTVSLKTKFELIDDDHNLKQSRDHFLLHRERDARYLQEELNNALDKRENLSVHENRIIQDRLINSLKQEELSAHRDFHNVYVKNGQPRNMGRYRVGSLTESAGPLAPELRRFKDWNEVYHWEKAYQRKEPSPPALTPPSSPLKPFAYLDVQRSIPGPDAKYMLGPRNDYLKKEKNKVKIYAQFAQKTDEARRKLSGNGRKPDPAASVFLQHQKWLLEQQQAAQRGYNDVRDFKQLPRLAERYDPKMDHRELEEKIRNKGLRWEDYKKYL